MEGLIHKDSNFFIQTDFHDAVYFLPTVGLGPLGPEIDCFKGIPFVLHIAGGVLSWGLAQEYFHRDNNGEIIAEGSRVISRAHRVRYVIVPHMAILPPTPPNLRQPLLIASSDHKNEMAAASVVGPDGPITVAPLWFLGITLTCNEPFYRLKGRCFTASTVSVGFTWGDVLAALVMSLIDMLLSAIAEFVGNRIGGAFYKLIMLGGDIIAGILFLISIALYGTSAIFWGLGGTAPIGAAEDVGGIILDILGVAIGMGAETIATAVGEVVSQAATEGISLGMAEAFDAIVEKLSGGDLGGYDDLFTPISEGVDAMMAGSEELS